MAINKVIYKDKTLIDLTDDNVTPETLLENTTAHSASGEKIVGCMINLSNDTVTPDTLARGTTAHNAQGQQIVGEMEGGLNTSDATAVAGDIVIGKTAYVNNGKVTGTLEKLKKLKMTPGTFGTSTGSVDGYNSVNIRLNMIADIPEGVKYYMERNMGGCDINIPLISHGNAEPSDVAKGKTFTSSFGFQQTGTAVFQQSGSGSQVKIGTTESSTINTGLTEIKQFILFANNITAVGLTSFVLNQENSVSGTLTFCGDYSIYMKGCKIETANTYSITGGTFTWKGTIKEKQLMAGATYNWIAIGN